jgi:hypothetical protein
MGRGYDHRKVTSLYERKPGSNWTKRNTLHPEPGLTRTDKQFPNLVQPSQYKMQHQAKYQLVKYKDTHCFTLSGMLACSSGTTSANSAKLSTKFSLRLNLELHKQIRKEIYQQLLQIQ